MHMCISWMYKSTNCTLHYTYIHAHRLITHTHTHTRHTSRLSLCFQLRGGPRGNQNFDTPGWKRRAEKPGTARGVHVRTDVRVHLQTRSSGAHRFSLSFQAGDRPRCTENVKTWHWGEEKSCAAQFAAVYFSSTCLEGGRSECKGLVKCYDLTASFYFMK